MLLATGSRPLHPPLFDFDDPDVLDSESLPNVSSLADSVAVVGGGPIGCEYASIFRALDVRVTLIDIAPRLAAMLDVEISERLAGAFERLGIDVRLGTSVHAVDHADGTLMLALEDGRTVAASKVLVAAGDVIGPPALASVAMEEGRRAASYALGTPLHEGARYEPPFGIHGVPEVAAAGFTEEQARAADIDYAVGRAEFSRNVRAAIAGAGDGMVKLVFRRDDRRLLGAHVIGDMAAEIIHLGQAVLQNGGGLDYFIQAPFNVPTWTDAYKYAAFDGLQQLEPGAPIRVPSAAGPAG